MSRLITDLRHSLRVFLRRPGLAALAIVSLGLGIGANTTIFSYVNAILLRLPPVEAPNQLAEVYTYSRLPEAPLGGYLPFDYDDYKYTRDHNSVFSGLVAYEVVDMVTWTGKGQSRRLYVQMVSGNFFDVLGVRPALGRAFLPQEDTVGNGNPVIVISYAMWQKDFGGNPNVLGQTMSVNEHSLTIVGVAPANFNGVFAGVRPHFWLPINMARTVGLDYILQSGNRSLFGIGRLKPGVSLATATANLKTIAEQINSNAPGNHDKDWSEIATAFGYVPVPFRQNLGAVAGLLMTVVGLVLLIACANAANLLLVQATGRTREMGIRMALGASRARLIGQNLTESLFLGIAAGGAGLLFATWAAPLLMKLRPPDYPIELSLSPDTRVLTFTLVLGVLTGIIFGLAPAIRGTRSELINSVKEGTPGAGHVRSYLRDSIVIVQLGVCVVVLIAAGLCLRSLSRAQLIDPGFDTQHLISAEINPRQAGHRDKDAEQFMQSIVERMRTLPGVESATMAFNLPMGTSVSDTAYAIEGVQSPPGKSGFDLDYMGVGANYFRTTGTRLLSGRDFTEQDVAAEIRPVVVNTAFVQRFWPGQNAIGKSLRSDNGKQRFVVIGVAETGKYRSLGEAPRPYVFRPTKFGGVGTLIVRVAGDPQAMLGSVRSTLQQIDPMITSDNIETIQTYMAAPLFPARFAGILLTAFGALALVLATVGIYGVIAYSVSQRTREFGIRVAIGAATSAVVSLVLREAGRRAFIGIVAGVGAAFVLLNAVSAFLHENVLYNVGTTDPVTYIGVAAFLLTVALAACYVPARRAARVDPVKSLRYE